MNTTYETFRESQKTFQSTAGKIRFIDKGAGPVILLLHGIPTSSWLYRNIIDKLIEGGNRIIAPDMLGFGNSDNPKGYEIYSQEAHASRILALMDSINVKQWTHVMHDAGGLWTWELMKKAPTRIRKLVILNTIIYKDGFNPPLKMKKGVFAKAIMWMYRNGVTTRILLFSLFKMGLTINNMTKQDIKGYKIPLLEGKTNAMYYFFTQTSKQFPDYSSVFHNMNIPVMVIWGKHDKMLEWTPQKEKVMNSLHVQAKDIHILDAKHFIQEEKPIKIASLIQHFINGSH